MYLFIKLVTLTLLAFCWNPTSNELALERQKVTQAVASIKCGDLLSRYAKKPAKLNFVNCASGAGQVLLEAKYRVSGTDSKEVEDFLVNTYGLGKLQFVCCGWESRNGKNGQIDKVKGLEDYPNYSITISMFANAEKESTEENGKLELDRNEIAYFTVLVQIVDV